MSRGRQIWTWASMSAATLCLLTMPSCARRAEPISLDHSGGKDRTIYWLLGAFDEYLGRRVIGDGGDRVEAFYCNERLFARQFRQVLSRLATEQGVADDVREVVREECLTVLRSATLAPALNALYRTRSSTHTYVGPGPPGDPAREFFELRVSDDMFENASHEARAAYVAGAYARYGKDSSIVLANAEHKADVLATLLRSLGVAGIRRRSIRNTLPNTNAVYFDATPELMGLLTQDHP